MDTMGKPHVKTTAQRRGVGRVKFTRDEEDELIRLVKLHGNQWRIIHGLGDFLPCRQPTHLKDKYRNLIKAGRADAVDAARASK